MVCRSPTLFTPMRFKRRSTAPRPSGWWKRSSHRSRLSRLTTASCRSSPAPRSRAAKSEYDGGRTGITAPPDSKYARACASVHCVISGRSRSRSSAKHSCCRSSSSAASQRGGGGGGGGGTTTWPCAVRVASPSGGPTG
eukprot:1986805-Prymnesium_polylepis.1